MRNLKVSVKLIISFMVVIVLAIIIGAIGILGMSQINAADDALYNGNYLPTVLAGDISQGVVNQRVLIRNFVIYDVNRDSALFTAAQNALTESRREMEVLFQDYDKTIVNPEDRTAFNNFTSLYNGEWKNTVDHILELGVANRSEEAKQTLVESSTVAENLNVYTARLQEINMADGEISVHGNTTLFNTMTFISIGVIALAIIISLALALYISALISKPLSVLTAFMEKAGGKGDIELSQEESESLTEFSKRRDELGRCISSTTSFIKRLAVVGSELEVLAGGDLTVDHALLSDRDTMGLSLKKMLDSLNRMFAEINSSTAQVSTGAKQIADGAQSLAQGSTEQAAAVQQLSSSISEVAETTKENAEMAKKASQLAEVIKGNAEKGSMQMDTMMDAVREINQASQSINKVIKVIDDIAFQTNILALNAAVEAARAGQHGKGFAVVAEEVRNLAGKSAEAAKDTGGLIANSMEKAELGARIAEETAASLSDIVSGINESTEIVSDIAKSSEAQSIAIDQINKGIDQVAQVVQQNSATAQESAAASEEMSGQSDMLESLIAQFKLKDQGNSRFSPINSSSKHSDYLSISQSSSNDESHVQNFGGEYGKY